MKIITNNQLVYDKYAKSYQIEYYDKSYLEILVITRDYIHEGYVLLTHPLSSSIKPGETPFKSIMIRRGFDDFNSEMMISDAITITVQMIKEGKQRIYNNKLLDDFMLIDCDVISSGIESYTTFGVNAK